MKNHQNFLTAFRYFCLLAIVVFGWATIVGTGGSSSSSSDDNGNDATISDFVGTWGGDIEYTSGSEGFIDNITLKIIRDGDILEGTLIFDEDEDNADYMEGTVSDGKWVFDLSNSDPGHPDCANWDVSGSAELRNNFNQMKISASGTFCGHGGGEQGTFEGTLSKLSGDNDGDPTGPTGDTFTNSIGMEFVYIEPGSFIMGSPEDEPGHESEEIQHEVTLTQGYYMQTTEVTQGQWKEVMEDNPSYFSDCGDDCPVENVSWNDAKDFIDALNTMGEETYRLPTEAQWEYAARAGSTTAFANGEITEIYDGYDPVLDSMGWYTYNSHAYHSTLPSGKGTQPVAQKDPNAWGLYDMHGNVYELVADWYGDYPTSAVTDPTGPASGTFRVMRGGSWHSHAKYCRSAYRSNHDPNNRDYGYGFRLSLLSGH